MTTYLASLPSDLLIQFILNNFSPLDVIKNINVINMFSITFNQYFWKELWQRDISTLNIPENITYENYRSVIEDDEFREYEEIGVTIMNMDRIRYFAENRYDILLYSFLDNDANYDESVRQYHDRNIDTSYNFALSYAAEANCVEIMEKIMEKVDKINTDYKKSLGDVAEKKNKINLDYDRPLCEGARNGNHEIVNWMLSLGATDYGNSLESAAIGGHEDMIHLMVNLLNNDSVPDKLHYYNRAMGWAAMYGHKHIIEIMLGLGANDYNSALVNAADGNQMEIIEWMLTLGATNYNGALNGAAFHAHLNVIMKMLDLGANSYDEAFENAINGVLDLTDNHIETIKFLLTLPITNYDIILAQEKRMKRIKHNDELIELLELNKPANN